MVDFRKMMLERMTPERRESYLFWEEAAVERRQEAESWTDKEVLEKFRYYLSNSRFARSYGRPTNSGDDCIYDAALWHHVIPELVKRYQTLLGGLVADADQVVTSGEPDDCCNAGHILRDAEKDCRNLRQALANLLAVLRSDSLHDGLVKAQLDEESGYQLYTCLRDGDDALEGIPID